MLTLADVLEALTGQRLESLAASYVADFSIDSREATRGDVFVAFKGERTDGHKHVGQALGRGAIATLVEDELDPAIVQSTQAVMMDTRNMGRGAALLRPYDAGVPLLIRVDSTEAALQKIATFWRSKFAKLRVIGVTGSIGKTSTKELISQVLSVRYNVLKSEGNLNNGIGVPLTLLRLMPEHEVAVIEMGMDRLGEITSYCQWAKPQVGVVTNVGPVHLEKLGTIDNIALAKSELIEALPAEGVAVLNDDDERVRDMRKVSRARVISCGLSSRADVWAENIESHGLEGISMVLRHKQGAQGAAQLVRVPLLGAHSAQTVLRAAAVGLAEGMGMGEIVEGLMSATPEQLRLVVAKGPFDSLVIDDTYNASAESTIAALNLLKDLEIKPRIAVLGDMLELGSAERDEHEEVGCRAALVVNFVVAVGQRAKWIAQSAIECGLDKSHVFVVANNTEALDVLSEIVTQRSAILVKGSRGMRMEEIVEGLGGMTSDE